jgi:hypothetical protein
MQPEMFHSDQFGRGQKYQLELDVTPEVRLPVLPVRGSVPGKTLVATGAVHGD